MNLAWVTDIHLNFLDVDARRLFYQKITDTNCNALLISGDIAEAPCLEEILCEMAWQVKRPICFVLGNHDYYRGQVNQVREVIIRLTKSNELFFWLPASGIQLLIDDTILLGQDGWSDGRLGDYKNSRVTLNDSRMISDLFQEKILGKCQLLYKMQRLADVDALELKNNLTEAITRHPKQIIVLTHVPPFKEACLHEGNVSDDNWLPFFSAKVMGDVLMKVAHENPSIKFLTLCGHTHGAANYQPLSNLNVKAGRAEYYLPEIQEIITL